MLQRQESTRAGAEEESATEAIGIGWKVTEGTKKCMTDVILIPYKQKLDFGKESSNTMR